MAGKERIAKKRIAFSFFTGQLPDTRILREIPRIQAIKIPGWLFLRRQLGTWQLHFRRNRRIAMVRQAMVAFPDHKRFSEMNFTFAVIALAAKLAKIDGSFREEEFIAFRQAFPLPGEEIIKIRRLFESALKDSGDVKIHARRIRLLFPETNNQLLLESVLSRLIDIARIDGRINAKERHFLEEIAQVFHISRRRFLRLVKLQDISPPGLDPYIVLHVKPGWDDKRIRHSYLHLIRAYHPDTIQARGGSREALKAAGDYMALLNNAYATICRERNNIFSSPRT